VTSGMIVAARLNGRVVLGHVQSLRQNGDHIEYTLDGVHESGQDIVTDRDLVGRGDRTVPLVGWPLIAARLPLVEVLGGLLVVSTIVMLVFVGRTPLDYLDEEDHEVFELEPTRVLALSAGPTVPTATTAMAYVDSPMSITPDDLRQVRFAQTRKGYDTEAVDRALDTVADSLDAVLAERQQLLERLRAAEAEIDRYKGLESQLGQTLAMAERSAEQVKADAEAEAQRILAEAQAAAQSTAPAAPAATSVRPDGATVELLGEMRAIRSLLQAALQPGGPLQQQRPPGQ
jgi:DivIVA domain-containing protein